MKNLKISIHQDEFDATYIGASEITDLLQITRSAISQTILKGKLPPAILFQGSYIWLRAEVQEYLVQWCEAIKFKRLNKKLTNYHDKLF